jgi:predicted GNAT family N-acyltransferase
LSVLHRRSLLSRFIDATVNVYAGEQMDGMLNITIRPANPSEVIDLRHRILRSGLARETAIFDGDDAPTTLHFVAEQDHAIVGCATLVLSEWQGRPAWQLRGMAVDDSFRGRGIGKALLAALEGSIAEQPVSQLWCNARSPAVSFYERSGWVIASEEFVIPTAGPHRRMTRQP